MKKVIYVCSGLLGLWFLLPFFRHGIVNIGNITGVISMMMIALLTYIYDKLKYKKVIFSFIGVLCFIVSFLTYLMIDACITSQSEGTVIVLGCLVKGNKPSLMLKERLDAAYSYLNKYPDTKCIVSGGQGSQENISEAQCMYDYLIEKGIDKNRLYKEDQSTSTRENFTYSYKIIEDNHLSKDVTVITNEFHMYRARVIARKLGLKTNAYSAHTALYLLPTYYVRELYGIIYEYIM